MAITKSISSKAKLKTAIEYITRKDKTKMEYMDGIGCDPENALEEMIATKRLWKKTGGRQYKHFTVSYAPGENITPEQAQKNVYELIQNTPALNNYECLIVTHIDKKHIHSHVIVNSVNPTTGKKLQWSKKDLQELKDRTNEQSRQQGLSVPIKGKTYKGTDREEIVAYDKDTYQFLKKAEKSETKSYVQDIAVAVLRARSEAVSREDFIKRMEQTGYGVDWQDNHKYITFTDQSRKDAGEKQHKIRNNKLEKYYNVDFTKEGMENEFNENLSRRRKEKGTKSTEIGNSGTTESKITGIERNIGQRKQDIKRQEQDIEPKITGRKPEEQRIATRKRNIAAAAPTTKELDKRRKKPKSR